MALERVEWACCGAHRVHAVVVEVFPSDLKVSDRNEECAGGKRDDGCVVRFVVCSSHPVRLVDVVLDLGSSSAVGPTIVEEVASIFLDTPYNT